MEKTLAPLTSSAEEVEAVGSLVGRAQPSVHVVPPASSILAENINIHTSGEVDTSQKDLEEPSWTTVRRRRARRLDSSDLAKKSHLESKGQRGLTNDQAQTVKAVAEAMTKSQRTLVDNITKKLPHRRGNSSSSRGEGPSHRKGKGIDPKEWGNINISQESLDVDAQEAALQSLVDENLVTHKRNTRVGRIPQARDYRSSSRLPAESRPIAQLAKDSYLGKTLRNIGKPTRDTRSRYWDDRSPSPSDPGSSDEE